MSNVTCFKHPTYRGETPPDLSCKVCCSRFVTRIRAEQSAKFEEFQKVSKSPFQTEEAPKVRIKAAVNEQKSSKKSFDSSWI